MSTTEASVAAEHGLTAAPDADGEPDGGDLTGELKAAMTAAWDHGADDYDTHWGHGLLTDTEHDAWLALLDRLLPRSQPLRILDVGTGTGFFALLLSELGHDVTGIDLSEERTWLDELERSVMPLEARLRDRYRRYLLEGRRPGWVEPAA